MKTLKTTKQFKKDVNRLKKQRKDFDKLRTVLDIICEDNYLEAKYRDHKLTGNYVKSRECHIEPDWLLIYEVDDDTVILRRTGSHSELFKM
jgi:mRNA interferase YafQ